jgi:hypothetical protein
MSEGNINEERRIRMAQTHLELQMLHATAQQIDEDFVEAIKRKLEEDGPNGWRPHYLALDMFARNGVLNVLEIISTLDGDKPEDCEKMEALLKQVIEDSFWLGHRLGKKGFELTPHDCQAEHEHPANYPHMN